MGAACTPALLAGETGKRPCARWQRLAAAGRQPGPQARFGVPLDRWFAQPAGRRGAGAAVAPERKRAAVVSAGGLEQVLAQASVPGRRK